MPGHGIAGADHRHEQLAEHGVDVAAAAVGDAAPASVALAGEQFGEGIFDAMLAADRDPHIAARHREQRPVELAVEHAPAGCGR